MRVAVFGGSFDPPHVGHVLAASYARCVGFDQVLVMPVKAHAFAKAPAPFEDRVNMCKLAFEALGGVSVSELEGSLPEPNYTLHTVEALHAQHPDWTLQLLIGSDVLKETSRWYKFDRVKQLAPPFILGRLGFEGETALAAILPEVASTEIRELLKTEEHPEDHPMLSRWVPRAVLKYIHEHRLYRA